MLVVFWISLGLESECPDLNTSPASQITDCSEPDQFFHVWLRDGNLTCLYNFSLLSWSGFASVKFQPFNPVSVFLIQLPAWPLQETIVCFRLGCWSKWKKVTTALSWAVEGGTSWMGLVVQGRDSDGAFQCGGVCRRMDTSQHGWQVHCKNWCVWNTYNAPFVYVLVKA